MLEGDQTTQATHNDLTASIEFRSVIRVPKKHSAIPSMDHIDPSVVN